MLMTACQGLSDVISLHFTAIWHELGSCSFKTVSFYGVFLMSIDADFCQG